MKVTRATEMAADLSQLEEAVKKFEEQWKQEGKGLNYYHLVISGELNKETCKKVKELYTEAGWQKVQCRTSSENGERAGLTGLILEYNTNH